MLTTITPLSKELKEEEKQLTTTSTIGSYNGILRLYVVEPTSRWDNYDRYPYHYGFLDFAYNDFVSIPYLDTYTDTITWNAQEA